MEKNYLSTEEAAVYLGVSTGTLENWRAGEKKEGPEFCKPAGRVYYRIADLDAWIESGRTNA